MRHISVDAFREVVSAEQGNVSVDFINVCTPAEYQERHIKGVRNVPLDDIEKRAAEFSGKSTVYIHCRSGNRGRQAIERLQRIGVTAELVNVEGGIEAWREAGFDTASFTNRLPIMRQVLIAAGTLMLLGVVLSLAIDQSFIYLSAAVGAGLVFAGMTGWCGMSKLLAIMPWNKT